MSYDRYYTGASPSQIYIPVDLKNKAAVHLVVAVKIATDYIMYPNNT